MSLCPTLPRVTSHSSRHRDTPFITYTYFRGLIRDIYIRVLREIVSQCSYVRLTFFLLYFVGYNKSTRLMYTLLYKRVQATLWNLKNFTVYIYGYMVSTRLYTAYFLVYTSLEWSQKNIWKKAMMELIRILALREGPSIEPRELHDHSTLPSHVPHRER